MNKDRIGKGLLVLKPLTARDVEAGSIGIVYIDKDTHIVTLVHIDHKTNSWFVMGNTYNGLLQEDQTIYTLQVDIDDATYPVAVKSWKKIISDNLINKKDYTDFIITPYKFKEGKYMQVCSICHASFIASKSQPLCKKCCIENSTAAWYPKGKRKRKKRYGNNSDKEN